jgi:hypothetical protein
MTKQARTTMLAALLIVAALVSAYVIVAASPRAMSGSPERLPAGLLH